MKLNNSTDICIIKSNLKVKYWVWNEVVWWKIIVQFVHCIWVTKHFELRLPEHERVGWKFYMHIFSKICGTELINYPNIFFLPSTKLLKILSSWILIYIQKRKLLSNVKRKYVNFSLHRSMKFYKTENFNELLIIIRVREVNPLMGYTNYIFSNNLQKMIFSIVIWS